MSALPVCKKCGWYEHSFGEKCSPARGAAADRIARMLPDVPSTKLGYGHGLLTFTFAPHHKMSLTLRVHEGGTFSLEGGTGGLHCLKTFHPREGRKFLEAIAAAAKVAYP